MAPQSYQAPKRGDASDATTKSQSVDSNIARGHATVGQLLEGKGSDIFSVRSVDTIADVVKILRDKRIGAVMVTDQNGAVEGILSERDIVRRMADTPGQTLPQSVSELMTANVQSCAPSDLLLDVLKRMSEGRFRHMPVVEDERLCGMITIGDVVNHRLKELEYEALKMKQMIVG